MDIITEIEHKKLPFQFYLKRTVWVHPLRYDNAAYIDSMFDQVRSETVWIGERTYLF